MEANTRREINVFLKKINSDFSSVKFSIYRTALKLGKLQDYLSLSNVTVSFARSQLSQLKLKGDDLIDSSTLRRFLINVMSYSAGQADPTKLSKITTSTAMLLSELFQDKSSKSVPVRAILLFLVLLSWDDVKQKHHVLFKVYSYPGSTLSRLGLSRMLKDTLKVVGIVSENLGGVSQSVESCFQGVLGSEVSEEHFMKWVLEERNKCLVWLPTMHRLKYATASVHDVQCSVCLTRPMFGMRFQCLKCLNYNTCQVCFLLQKVAPDSNHRVSHPQQEYCSPAGKKDQLNSLARTLRNKMTKRYKHKQRLLPDKITMSGASSSIEYEPQSPPKDEEKTADDVEKLVKEENKRLKSLVSKLDSENEVMAKTVSMLQQAQSSSSKDDHDLQVLHGKLDNLTQHNRSLENELENLKSAVFSSMLVPQQQQQTPALPPNGSRGRRSASVSRSTNSPGCRSRSCRSSSLRPKPHQTSLSSMSVPTSMSSTERSSSASRSDADDNDPVGSKLERLLTSLEKADLAEEQPDACHNSLKSVSEKLCFFLDVALSISAASE